LLHIYIKRRRTERATELEAVHANLAKKDRELSETLAERERCVKKVEIKLLSTYLEMAAYAADLGQWMRDKENELKECKVCSSR